MNNDLISRRKLDGMRLVVPDFVKVDQRTKGWNECITYIQQNAPAVDAVPVVRCKDCEEYIPWLRGNICGLIGSYYGDTKPNDFCSRGRRKEKAGE